MIIFDLDDTLIDTSGSVTPFKLKCALAAMLGPASTEMLLEELIAINNASLRTADALVSFASVHHVPDELLRRALEELSAPLPEDFEVRCTPNAKQILNYYHRAYPLALVTGGARPFQLEKLKKAGISASFFSKIAVPEDSIKKPVYCELSKEIATTVWVCGDRISMDLAPARELGFKTIHMRWGRGLGVPSAPWIDHSISDLAELRKIIP